MDASVSTVQAGTLLKTRTSVQVEGENQPPVLARENWMVRKHLQESPNRVSLKHEAAREMLAASKTKPSGWLVQPDSLAPKGTPRSVKL